MKNVFSIFNFTVGILLGSSSWARPCRPLSIKWIEFIQEAGQRVHCSHWMPFLLNIARFRLLRTLFRNYSKKNGQIQQLISHPLSVLNLEIQLFGQDQCQKNLLNPPEISYSKMEPSRKIFEDFKVCHVEKLHFEDLKIFVFHGRMFSRNELQNNKIVFNKFQSNVEIWTDQFPYNIENSNSIDIILYKQICKQIYTDHPTVIITFKYTIFYSNWDFPPIIDRATGIILKQAL